MAEFGTRASDCGPGELWAWRMVKMGIGLVFVGIWSFAHIMVEKTTMGFCAVHIFSRFFTYIRRVPERAVESLLTTLF